MRHIAIESGAFVVSVPQYIPAVGVPRRLPGAAARGQGGLRARRRRDLRADDGEVIAGPLYDEEGIVVADCDLRAGLRAKRWFDVVGHYSREDVLARDRAAAAHGDAPAPTVRRRPSRTPPPSLGLAAVRYPVESFTAAERAPARAALHQPRPARLLPRQPARDGQGGAVRALLALPGDAAAALPRGVRRATCRRAGGRSTGSRASAPPASTSASSSATATTRSPRSAAPTSPASGSPTCSPRSSSAAGSPPTSSSRPATSPTTSRSRRAAATATTPTTSSGPPTREAMDELFAIYSRSLETVQAWAAERWPRDEASPRAPGGARSGPRRSTCCAGCCPPRP